jgi:hypothetical protein
MTTVSSSSSLPRGGVSLRGVRPTGAFAAFGIDTHGRRLEDISARPGQPVAARRVPWQGVGN